MDRSVRIGGMAGSSNDALRLTRRDLLALTAVGAVAGMPGAARASGFAYTAPYEDISIKST